MRFLVHPNAIINSARYGGYVEYNVPEEKRGQSHEEVLKIWGFDNVQLHRLRLGRNRKLRCKDGVIFQVMRVA